MKALLLFLISIFFIAPVMAQSNKPKSPALDKNKEILIVEAACGQCRLELRGNSCDLAVKINGKSYFVDGTDIDSHGDAHAKDGFCNSIRKAKVQGEIINNRFKATYFQLLPEVAAKQESK